MNTCLSKRPNIMDTLIQLDSRITIVVCYLNNLRIIFILLFWKGDINGQFYDLLTIFNKNGLPSQTNKYIFNGNLGGYGPFSTEVLLTIYSMMIELPDSVFVLRGSNETEIMAEKNGLKNEV